MISLVLTAYVDVKRSSSFMNVMTLGRCVKYGCVILHSLLNDRKRLVRRLLKVIAIKWDRYDDKVGRRFTYINGSRIIPDVLSTPV